MAFGKRFESQFYSLAGHPYQIKIYDDGYTGSARTITVGKGGPKLKYKADEDDRYNTILASTLTIPFIADDSLGGLDLIAWREELRTVTADKKTYIHLYKRSHGSSVSGISPIWSGFVLMDLSQDEDVSTPYEIQITATDGLSLLKEVDFVDSGATKPYVWGDRILYKKRITDLIYKVLNKIGAATTSEGAGVDWGFSTSVNWYNEEHQGTTKQYDPLYLTKYDCRIMYERVVADDGSVTYNAPNCYDVLKSILLFWGCRITYWDHNYYIVQIDAYDTAAGGTFNAPDNVNTRYYSDTGSHSNDKDYLGTKYNSQYQLDINNTSIVSEYIKRLTGTIYDYYPAVKEVETQSLTGGDTNYFSAFPEGPYDGSAPQTFQQEPIDNMASASAAYLEFDFTVTHDQASAVQNSNPLINTGNAGTRMDWAAFDLRLYFKVTLVHGGTTYNLKQAGPSAPCVWQTSAYGNNQYLCAEFVNVPKNGTKTQTFSYNINTTTSPATGFTGLCDPIKIEYALGAPAAGEWSTSVYSSVIWRDHNNPTSGGLNGWLPACGPSSGTYIPTSNPINTYSTESYGLEFRGVPNANSQWTIAGTTAIGPQYNVPSHNLDFVNNTGGPLSVSPYKGSFVLIQNNTSSASTISQSTNTTDTYSVTLPSLLWGDVPNASDNQAIQVWDGSAWVGTDFNGKWGIGTTSGTIKINVLLLQEYLRGGSINIRKAAMELVMSESGFTKNDGSGFTQKQYISPITKLRETAEDSTYHSYIFQRGTFFISEDRWNGEWFQFNRDASLTMNTNTISIISPFSSRLGLGGAGTAALARRLNYNTYGMVITNTTATISAGARTEFDILAINYALFLDGDPITLLDVGNGMMHSLTINATQASADETLTIDSYTFPFDVEEGALVFIDKYLVAKQYQHKTTGTIAGMPVDADELGCIKYTSGDGTYTIDADTIIGVDLDYIKILPSDFLANDDNTTYSVAWKDGSGQTGVIPEDGALEMFAFVSIPSGKTATKVDVWGSNAKALNVYEHDVNAGAGMGTAIGTGTVNTELDITDTASTATNFLVIKITTTATSNRIYGGKVTIIDTP
tara:strand:- start:1148 stop:4384 length:3237 start_codon:yes stop_codon:yes gene_type:complete